MKGAGSGVLMKGAGSGVLMKGAGAGQSERVGRRVEEAPCRYGKEQARAR